MLIEFTEDQLKAALYNAECCYSKETTSLSRKYKLGKNVCACKSKELFFYVRFLQDAISFPSTIESDEKIGKVIEALKKVCKSCFDLNATTEAPVVQPIYYVNGYIDPDYIV